MNTESESCSCASAEESESYDDLKAASPTLSSSWRVDDLLGHYADDPQDSFRELMLKSLSQQAGALTQSAVVNLARSLSQEIGSGEEPDPPEERALADAIRAGDLLYRPVPGRAADYLGVVLSEAQDVEELAAGEASLCEAHGPGRYAEVLEVVPGTDHCTMAIRRVGDRYGRIPRGQRIFSSRPRWHTAVSRLARRKSCDDTDCYRAGDSRHAFGERR